MSAYSVGDVVTFRLHDDQFGLARVIFIESLSQFDRIHLQVMDAVLSAGPGGFDANGEPTLRTHDMSQAGPAPVVVDHLCVELDAFQASEPMIVDHAEVSPDDLTGYRVWLALQHEHMVRSGIIRDLSRSRVEPDEEFDDGDSDESAEDESPVEAVEEGGDAPMEEDPDAYDDGSRDGMEGESDDDTRTITVRPWHSIVLREPVGDGLVNLHAAFREPDLQHTRLGAYLCGIYSSDNVDRINELAEQLLDGDFGAGQELMEFGDAAVEVLASQLPRGHLDAQQTEDVLNILTDIATPSAYDAIAAHVERHAGDLDSEMGHGIARAFCYAVMLTGGSPPSLRRLLGMLDTIDHPDLRADVANARNAVINAGPPDVTDAAGEPQGTSSTPFGAIGT